jgi:hypothetical protein
VIDSLVITGLDPAIHSRITARLRLDVRVEPGMTASNPLAPAHQLAISASCRLFALLIPSQAAFPSMKVGRPSDKPHMNV